MNSKPKLLVVCRSFGVPSEIWISRQIESFDAFDTAVLCWNRVQGGTQANVPVEELGTDFDAPERSPARWLRRLLSRPSGNMRGAWGSERKQLIERTQRLEPDVVLCHFGHTALRFLPAAEALGIPVVAHFHGLDLSSSLQDRYYRWSLERRIHRFAHMVVVGSHQQRKLCELGARPERISRIPCGAPASAFLPSTRHTSGCCRFIMVSRLVAWKGPDLTLRAFARARQSQPNMELHVVGTGPMEGELKRLAMDLHLNDSVVFHGSLAPAKVHELLAASDVFLQHSLNYHTGWEEGFGVSITEASATGLPVVVTRCGGIPDQVTDGENGFLVEQNDCEAMAERMVRLARTPELRERLGRAGRKRVEQEFDCALLTRRLQDCLLAAAKQAKQAIPAQWNNNPAQSTQGTPAVNHVRS